MSTLRIVRLHLGAHKTATTHFQRALRTHSDVLRRRGIRFYGPSELRQEGQTLQERFGLPGSDPISCTALERADQMAGGARLLVLSDENFPGHFAGPKGRILRPLYPRTCERVGALAEALKPLRFEVFIGIRAPAGYLTSTYSQLLYAGMRMTPFDFFPDNPMHIVDWANLVTRLHSLEAVHRIIVWRFEDYFRHGPQISRRFLGWRGAWGLRLSQQPEHLGLSEAALAQTLEGFAAGTEGRLAVQARKMFPISDEHPRFDPFTSDEHARSEALYADQIAQISALRRVVML